MLRFSEPGNNLVTSFSVTVFACWFRSGNASVHFVKLSPTTRMYFWPDSVVGWGLMMSSAILYTHILVLLSIALVWIIWSVSSATARGFLNSASAFWCSILVGVQSCKCTGPITQANWQLVPWVLESSGSTQVCCGLLWQQTVFHTGNDGSVWLHKP